MKILARTLLFVGALFLFILSLELLKKGAGGVMPLLRGLHVQGVLNTFGLGWLMAYCVLSGSPIAAVALTLFGAHQVSDVEALGMIAGSRFGAAFVVLLLGAIHYFRTRATTTTVATGVLCLLVTWTIYTPATFIGYGLLTNGILEGATLPTPAAMSSLLDVIYDPITGMLARHLHPGVMFVCGILVLLSAFHLFDRALPTIDPGHSRFRQIAFVVYRTDVMFLLGIAVTCMTLSVSVSLGLLVPLSAKGYVRRENIVPYIMGANISTFIDTLVASLLVGEPRAFSIVLAEMLSVALCSLIVLLGFYQSYRDALEWCLRSVTRNRTTIAVFAGAIMIVPLLLMLI